MATNIQQHGRLSSVTVYPAVARKSGEIFTYGTTKILGVAETNYYLTDAQGASSNVGVGMALSCVVSIGITAAQAALAMGALAKFNFTTQLLDSTAVDSAVGTVIGFDAANNLYTVKLFEYLNGAPTIA